MKDEGFIMSDYWKNLLNYEQGKEHKYFRAQLDANGEAIESTICEVNFTEERDRIKEQIQHDIDCYISSQPYGDENEQLISDLQTIIVNNFKGFE